MTLSKLYFLDKKGVATGRLQGAPGQRHVEIATTILGPVDPGADFYAAMFRLKYIRMAEDNVSMILHVDTPVRDFERLSIGQRRYLNDMSAKGWRIDFNNPEFIKGRDPAQ